MDCGVFRGCTVFCPCRRRNILLFYNVFKGDDKGLCLFRGTFGIHFVQIQSFKTFLVYFNGFRQSDNSGLQRNRQTLDKVFKAGEI